MAAVSPRPRGFEGCGLCGGKNAFKKSETDFILEPTFPASQLRGAAKSFEGNIVTRKHCHCPQETVQLASFISFSLFSIIFIENCKCSQCSPTTSFCHCCMVDSPVTRSTAASLQISAVFGRRPDSGARAKLTWLSLA